MPRSYKTELGKSIQTTQSMAFQGVESSLKSRTIRGVILRVVKISEKECLYRVIVQEKIPKKNGKKGEYTEGRIIGPIPLDEDMSTLALVIGNAENLLVKEKWCEIIYNGRDPNEGKAKIILGPTSPYSAIAVNNTDHKGTTFAEPQGGIFG